MRLPRKHIPLDIRCRVALQQLGEMWPNEIVQQAQEQHAIGDLLRGLLGRLAALLGCAVTDLRLDHDPALAAREKVHDRQGNFLGYIPHEHDPAHLRYRPHGAEHKGSHHIKTNVRGDHGQHPDRVLIKKQRRLEQAAHIAKTAKKARPQPKRPKRKYQWPAGRKLRGRGFQPRPH